MNAFFDFINQLFGLFGTYFLYQLVKQFVTVKENRLFKLFFLFALFCMIALPVFPNDINVAIIFLVFLGSNLFFLQGPFIHKFSLTMILFPFIIALNFLMEDIGLRLWVAGGEELALDLLLHGTMHFICGLTWFVMYQGFRSAIPFSKTQITMKLWVIIDLICLTPLVAMSSFVIFTPSDTRMVYPAAFACILTSICSLYMTGYIAQSFRYKLENQNLQLQGEYYQELERNQKQLRKVHHDMNNHFGVILNFMREDQPEQAEEYLGNLTQQHVLATRDFCKNTTINAVLNAKYQSMQDYQIHCSMQLDIDTMITIDDISLCSLFGNTLDNAIEAAKQAPKKEIKLKARYYNGFFSYKISNTKNHHIKKSGSRFFTTKKQPQDHGIGLQSVRSIVESYNGNLDINYDEDRFSLVVLISDI